MERLARTVSCRVELFGLARLAEGRSAVDLTLPAGATLRDAVAALARACPSLVGRALRDDPPGLLDGYVLNLGGLSFVRDLDAPVRPGESLLLLAGEAGG